MSFMVSDSQDKRDLGSHDAAIWNFHLMLAKKPGCCITPFTGGSGWTTVLGDKSREVFHSTADTYEQVEGNAGIHVALPEMDEHLMCTNKSIHSKGAAPWMEC